MKDTIKAIVSSSLTTIFTFIGIIGSFVFWLVHEADARDAKIVDQMRVERQAQIGELKTEIEGVKVLVQSVDGKVDILLQDRQK